jgi:acetolactate synthase regulatory subunit
VPRDPSKVLEQLNAAKKKLKEAATEMQEAVEADNPEKTGASDRELSLLSEQVTDVLQQAVVLITRLETAPPASTS